MKIHGNNDPVSRVHDVKSTHKAHKKVGDKNEVSSPAVEISNLANEMVALQGDIKDMPDVRAEKVNPLKQAIEQGTYQVDDDKLADALSRFLS